MSKDSLVLSLTNQALHYQAISELTGLNVSEVKEVIQARLRELDDLSEIRLTTPVKIELARIDSLISIQYADLAEVDDSFCEFTGKLLRDKYKMRKEISDNIRKLTETKIKLLALNVSLNQSQPQIEESPEEETTSNLTLEEKLTKYRDML